MIVRHVFTCAGRGPVLLEGAVLPVRFVPGFALAFVVFFAGASPTLAQSTFATLRGTVADASDAPLPDVGLLLVEEETGLAREATSGAGGEFAFALVPPGPHRLEASAPGFKRYLRRIVVQVNEQARARVVLELGAVTESVDVAADAARASGGPALSTVVDNRLVMGLPLDGRNFLELALLVPGAVPAPQGSAASVRGDFAFSVNGGREDANAFLLDGAENLDPKLNTPAVRPAVDAIREFEVLTSSYEAAFGRQGAAQVNVALKTGGNALRGTAYEFLRTGAFDARNVFAPAGEPAPEYERHQFGGSLGGPIVRGRAFFFASYEGTRAREGLTRLTNVPTAAERAGDFSQSLLPPPVDPFTRQPFPGHRVPEWMMHPVGRAIAALYPLPNRDAPFQNFVSSPVQRDDVDNVDGRVTQALGGGSELSVRYSLQDRRLFEPFAGRAFAAVPGFGTDVPRRGQHLVATDARVLSGALLSELRVAFTRVSAGATPERRERADNPDVGLPLLSPDPRDRGLSFITVAGYSPLGDEYNNPQHSTTGAWQVAETLTWTRGRHLVKIGGDLRVLRQDAFRDVQARGFLTFTDQAPYTGNALADLLLGLPFVTGGARLDNPQRLRATAWSLFAQDSWQVRPALTLSAGVRYEVMAPPVDRDDRASVYVPAAGGLVAVGTNGVPRGAYRADWNNLAPRLGLAWSPARLDRLVVRGGYGLYYNQSALAPSEGLYFSAPYFDFRLYFPLPGLPLTVSDPFPQSFPLALAQSATAYQQDMRSPYYHHWSGSVQAQVGPGGTLDVGYVASRGRNLLRARDLNQPAPSAGSFVLRPDPRFDDIMLIESQARSRYDSLQARYHLRSARGLSLLASYTLGRSMDDASGFFASAGDANFPQNSHDPGAEWGRSSFDVRHRLSVGAAWDVPLGQRAAGWTRTLLADWQVAGVVTAQSGRPFTVALLPEFDNSNTGRSSLGFGAGDRPNVIANPALDHPTPARWFDTGAFVVPPRGTFGDAGRNLVEGPGYANVNAALIKHLPLPRGTRLQVRAEAFNLFNRANYDQPDNFLGSPTFGQVLSAGSPRRLQLGARMLF
jgi:hypothetical protein